MEPTPLVVEPFVATTLGLLVYLTGVQVTRKVAFLREFNIPEPVSGGLVAAAIFWAVYVYLGIAVEFDLKARDYFLILFFTGIGLNARLSDLAAGGKPLLILLILTLIFIALQSGVGMVVASLFGYPAKLGVLLGSASLIGGHGTAIAWSPEVAAATGVESASEIGIAVATLGLVVAALLGGPIAKFLIARHELEPERPDSGTVIGLPHDDSKAEDIDHINLMRVLFVSHVVIILGFALGESIAAMGLKLPNFVPCLLVGIVVGNLLPVLLPGVPEIRRTPSLSLVSEFALGIFLAMSLMSLQLWTLAGSELLLAATMGAQTIIAVVFILVVLFRAMGSEYRAAVLSAGFAGFALGATPTAIANMTAVTKRYGPSPIAFVILPLVSAFFVDLANAGVIQTILGL
ncbi:MAG: sodium/glutamate symporter [Pseudomonadota bacterium]